MIFCVNCEASEGGCSDGDDCICNFARKEMIHWLLNQPYEYFRLAVEE